MSFLSSIPLWGWLDIGFNIVVFVALCGESHWALKWMIPNKSQGKTSVKWRREKLKKKFEFLLIIGIAGEVGCLPFSLKESSDSNRMSAGAKERTSTNELQVARLVSTNLLFEKSLRDLAHLYDQSTNALAEANARLATIRPFKERAIDLLTELDPTIVPRLKAGETKFELLKLPMEQYNRLAALIFERENATFIKMGVYDSAVLQLVAGFGQVKNVLLEINPLLVK